MKTRPQSVNEPGIAGILKRRSASARGLVLRLVLVRRRREVGVASSPEDLLELEAVGTVLEALVDLLFFHQHDGLHAVQEGLVVLVQFLGGGERRPDGERSSE